MALYWLLARPVGNGYPDEYTDKIVNEYCHNNVANGLPKPYIVFSYEYFISLESKSNTGNHRVRIQWIKHCSVATVRSCTEAFWAREYRVNCIELLWMLDLAFVAVVWPTSNILDELKARALTASSWRCRWHARSPFSPLYRANTSNSVPLHHPLEHSGASLPNGHAGSFVNRQILRHWKTNENVSE